MTRDVFAVVRSSTQRGDRVIVAATKESAWMELFATEKVGAQLPDAWIQAMSEYAADHKGAQEWLKKLGYGVVLAYLKIPEEPK